jgi:hypothetical protein
MYENFRILYEMLKEISFWLVGVWLLIAFAPIILPILMIADYMENH